MSKATRAFDDAAKVVNRLILTLFAMAGVLFTVGFLFIAWILAGLAAS